MPWSKRSNGRKTPDKNTNENSTQGRQNPAKKKPTGQSPKHRRKWYQKHNSAWNKNNEKLKKTETEVKNLGKT